jgi:hypothetical protein
MGQYCTIASEENHRSEPQLLNFNPHSWRKLLPSARARRSTGSLKYVSYWAGLFELSGSFVPYRYKCVS